MLLGSIWESVTSLCMDRTFDTPNKFLKSQVKCLLFGGYGHFMFTYSHKFLQIKNIPNNPKNMGVLSENVILNSAIISVNLKRLKQSIVRLTTI